MIWRHFFRNRAQSIVEFIFFLSVITLSKTQVTHYFFRENKIHSNRKRRDFLDNKISNITGGRKIKVRKSKKQIFFLTIIIFFVLWLFFVCKWLEPFLSISICLWNGLFSIRVDWYWAGRIIGISEGAGRRGSGRLCERGWGAQYIAVCQKIRRLSSSFWKNGLAYK